MTETTQDKAVPAAEEKNPLTAAKWNALPQIAKDIVMLVLDLCEVHEEKLDMPFGSVVMTVEHGRATVVHCSQELRRGKELPDGATRQLYRGSWDRVQPGEPPASTGRPPVQKLYKGKKG